MLCDDDAVRRVLIIRFEKIGYDIIIVNDLTEAIGVVVNGDPDLVILDISAPELDNHGVCKELRERSNIPIIILTALDEIESRVLGFHCGADDYLVKPFSLRELEARIASILRRTKWNMFRDKKHALPLKIGELEIDFNRRLARMANQELELTDAEFDILQLLVKNSGVLLSRTEIVQSIWGYDPYSKENLRRIDVYISRLRNLIESNPRQPEYIFTERGAGYFFRKIDNACTSKIDQVA